MFFPVSKPKYVFEAKPASIVNSSNPIRSTEYHVRPISSAELDAYVPYANLVTSLINASGDVKDLSNSLPVPTDFPSQGSSSPSSTSTPTSKQSDLDADVHKQVLQYLSAPAEVSSKGTDGGVGNQQSVTRGDDDVDIHRLATNEQCVLDIPPDTAPAFLSGNDERRIGADDFLTPAEAAMRKDVVDISKVFDLTNTNDVELFGLSVDDDDDGDEGDYEKSGTDDVREDENDGGLSSKLRLRSDEPQSQLDDELDTIIGESFGVLGDLGSLKKKKARLTRRKGHSDEVVWASEDMTDISEFSQLVPQMAIDYPFNLDIFQKRAVYRLERDENVFVAAHTSAGKTVVAEYAIALAMQRKTKVVYTAPIKTLSNQKFRDFTQRFTEQGFGEGEERNFGQVGIITGDISINPEADCLIMTTEILRSMLYKGADLIRDLSHVIFDECHWLNDPERGVVWEESIIMLPRTVTIVMLSATVPNAMEFAKWVGSTKEKPVYVVGTPKRPVPLSHNLFVKNEIYKLFDTSQPRFLDAAYRRAVAHHKESTKNANIRQGYGRSHAWMPIIKYLRKHSLDPAIFFCFSKKKCDEAAEQLNTQDLTSGATDKSHIHQFYQTAISRLSDADRNVPQITRHREMLKRGIGVHHAGLLPIIKEITEVLFQSGYIRILFATETFAMGVNMPARTVVFTAIHKYDSQSYRLLEPGEYIQMAGRAGRRGLDDVGTVLLYPTTADFPTESDVKGVLTGTPKPLRSQFRLTYNMILNLLRIDELRVEDVMARSFSEAPAGRTSGTVKKLLEKGSKTLSEMQESGTEVHSFRDLFHLSLMVEGLSRDINQKILSSKSSGLATLGTGRVILVRRSDRTLRLAVIVCGPQGSSTKTMPSLKPRLGTRKGAGKGKAVGPDEVKLAVLSGGPALTATNSPLCANPITKIDTASSRMQYNCNGIIIEVGNEPMNNVDAILSLRVEANERELNPIRGEPNIGTLSAVADELRRIVQDEQYWQHLPSVHPARDLGLQDLDTDSLWMQRSSALESMLVTIRALQESGAITDMVDTFHRLSKSAQLEGKLQKLRDATSDETLQLMPEYRQRALVLQRLGYIDETTVLLKGRAACEVNTCESIILTELVFEQVLQELSAVDLAAILSSLVFTERLEEGAAPGIEELQGEAPELAATCLRMDAVLQSVGDVLAEHRVGSSGKEYVRSHVRIGFVKGVRDWASGKTFADVCAVYDGTVPEGTIVRTIIRLCELLRELKNVGRVIGDPAMQKRAQEAVDLCKRDVIFAASLYVS